MSWLKRQTLSSVHVGAWQRCFSASARIKERGRQQMKSFSDLQYRLVGSYAIFSEKVGPKSGLNEAPPDPPKQHSRKRPNK
jgi:hypothetical protein